MTPEQIALVERSLATAQPVLDTIVEGFYARLFAAEPQIAAMFTSDPVRQRERFAAELGVIAASVRDYDAFLDEVRALGVRHNEYGVRAAHYRVAGPFLIDALADGLGDAWTADVAEAWRLAYNLTVEAMMAGAAGDV